MFDSRSNPSKTRGWDWPVYGPALEETHPFFREMEFHKFGGDPSGEKNPVLHLINESWYYKMVWPINETPAMENRNPEDEFYIREALREAEKAAALGEVPVGAVMVRDGEILARAHNLRETSGDPTAHAEILALRRASEAIRHWRMHGTTLYVTLEPCPMCAGAIVLARVDRLVFGAFDPKAGAAGSLMNTVQDKRLNHQLEVAAGVLAEDCGRILKDFFQSRR